MKHETLPEVVTNLLDGRTKIERGWCKGVMFEGANGQIRYCALGAVNASVLDNPEVQLLTKALPWPHIFVASYNDRVQTTKADILALYDRAIALGLEAP